MQPSSLSGLSTTRRFRTIFLKWLWSTAFASITCTFLLGQTKFAFYSFQNQPDAALPFGSLIADAKGNFYGTTISGGTSNSGAIVQVNRQGRERVLYSFTGGADGYEAYGSLTLDAAGNLYGVAQYGGGGSHDTATPQLNLGDGTIYKLDTAGSLTVLHTFSGADGEYPQGGLLRDTAGNLIGATCQGGKHGVGTIFKLDTSGKETTLYSFAGMPDGNCPAGNLVSDSAGNLYGATYAGGSADLGTVFQLSPTGSETVLYSFTGPDGSEPYSGVVRDASGNLFGTTYFGGSFNKGIAFKVDSSGVETILHSFTGGADGSRPVGSLIEDTAGNLYGTTSAGGGSADCGVVFMLNPSGNETVLHTFSNTDGCLSFASLFQDRSGTLHGTTYAGGAHGGGTIFRVAP